MFPELLRIGPIAIKTYGFFVAIGFLLGLYYIKSQSTRYNIPVQTITNLVLYILISGILGSRVLYVILNWECYENNILEIFAIWSGGLVLYGGILFATLTVIWYSRKEKLPIWQLVDLFAPSIFLGIAIGRIGCFSAGCCYGKETDLPFSIVFTNELSLAPLGKRLHPTQLYESVYCFILFVLLHWINKHRISRISSGITFLLGIVLYSIYRFFIEYLRGDDRGTMIFGLYPSQTISIGFLIVALIMLYFLYSHRKY